VAARSGLRRWVIRVGNWLLGLTSPWVTLGGEAVVAYNVMVKVPSLSGAFDFTMTTARAPGFLAEDLRHRLPTFEVDHKYRPVPFLEPETEFSRFDMFVLNPSGERFGHDFDIIRGLMSESDYERAADLHDRHGQPLVYSDPNIDTLVTCCGSPAVGNAIDVENLLDVSSLHASGMDGHDVALAIVDVGINLGYLRSKGRNPVLDTRSGLGWTRPGQPAQGAAWGRHGTMCAYDALIAAPKVNLIDVAILGGYAPPPQHQVQPLLSDAIAAYAPLINMMNAASKPYSSLVVSNSWGVSDLSWDVPLGDGRRYIDNINHLFNQSVAALVRAGADVVFAAGNCGPQCPGPKCKGSIPINGANSHPDVVTVGGVDINNSCTGYSSCGPGMIHAYKPDLAAYTHFIGSEVRGPATPDEGTSAAAPVLAGVIAAIRSKFPMDPVNPQRRPAAVKQLLIEEALAANGNQSFSPDVGWGTMSTLRLSQPAVTAVLA
jgi:subtilase family protein